MKVQFTLILCFCALVGLCQKASIRGIVQDESDQAIQGATAILVHPADSVLQYFSVTGPKGQFHIEPPLNDTFLLQISYLGFETYYRQIITADKAIDLGTILLQGAQKILDEVVIKEDRLPIRIKRDTIEYDADAFKTQPNATVEELFKKLPGVQVESDGTIKTQGKDVKKVLVDGKEFFGDDPKIATKNLPAEAVDKVQVFDKKSDIAEFTGVDDGVRDKTINLALKDSHKDGTFGNITAGYGDQDRYTSRLSLNRFSKNTRLSFLGSLNNINEQTFSISDYIMMSGGFQALGSGRIQLELGGADDIGLGGLQNGINTSYSSGINFSHDFSDKSFIQASYFFNGLTNDLDQTVQRQEFYPAGDLFSVSSTDRIQHRNNHRLNLTFDQKIDSTQQLKLTSRIGFNQFDQESHWMDQNTDAFESLLNESDRDQSLDGDRFSWNLKTAYRKKFNSRKGRYLALSGSIGTNTFDEASFLYSLNQFYQGIPSPIVDTISQEQIRAQDEVNYQGRLSFTEPIGKGRYLELSVEHGNDQRDVQQDVFDLISMFPEKILNEDLSDAFDQSFMKTSGGFRIQQKLRNTQLSIGAKYQQSELRGKSVESIEQLEKKFENFLPYLNVQYDFTSTNHINLNYRTYIREPSLRQLQPLVENSDPLNIYLGNPELRPEYRHSIATNYFSFSQFSGINFFASGDLTYTQNRIVNAKTIDELFKQTIQPINTDEAWQVFGNVNFGAPLRPINFRFNLSASIMYDQYESKLNGESNPIETLNQRFRIRFDNRNKDAVDIAFGGQTSWQNVKSTIGDAQLNQYRNQSLFIETGLNAIKNWSLEQSFNYNHWQGTAGVGEQHTSIWNIGLSRYFMDRRLEVKFQVVDLLNQNRGLTQNTGLNHLEFIQYRALGRYFMLSATYSLKKFGNSGPSIEIEQI